MLDLVKSRPGRILAVLALAVLCSAVDVAAGKKKKDKKKPAPAAAPQTSEAAAPAAAAGLAAPPEAVRAAQRHLLAYETEAARRALEGVAGDDAWGAAARGWLLMQENDFAGAIAETRRAAELDRRNPAPLLRLGESLTYAQKGGAQEAYSGAEERARALLDANGEDVDGLIYLGVAQQRRQKFDESAVSLERALQLAPSRPLAHFYLGQTRFYQQRWQPAFDQLTAAIEADAGIALAYYYRGLAAGKLDRKDVLYNDLDRFVRLAPEAPEAAYARQLLGAFGG